MRRARSASHALARAAADAPRVERARSPRMRQMPSACSTSAAASSHALSVPCPKNTPRARSRRAPRSMSARTVSAARRRLAAAPPAAARRRLWDNSRHDCSTASGSSSASAPCAPRSAAFCWPRELDSSGPVLASGTWLPRGQAHRRFPPDRQPGAAFTRAAARRPPDPGVLRLHPLSGCVPDDARRARPVKKQAPAAGLCRCSSSGRPAARHAGGARALPARLRPELSSASPAIRRDPAAWPPALGIGVTRVDLPGGGLRLWITRRRCCCSMPAPAEVARVHAALRCRAHFAQILRARSAALRAAA